MADSVICKTSKRDFLLWIYPIVGALGLFLLTGCQWKGSQKPSILVVAVESLNFDSITCDHNPRFGGFESICNESVRFTHAFTPSTMSQAALSSLLTGLYPVDHKVRHNGGTQYLSGTIRTAAEVAVGQGFRTSFFSGGPPIWRKSGLGQGFEIFEDNVRVNRQSQYRPASINFENFLLWLDRTVEEDPFFSVIYLADLQFPEVLTTSDLGEERGAGFDSQMEEISESLLHLIQNLKERNRWDMTHVIFTGLNGRHLRTRPNELDAFSLYGENTQVALYIKPARKKRDLGIEWKIDKNVSLVDVGATLFDLMGAPVPTSSYVQLEVSSLRSVLSKPEVNWNEDRLILLESHWPEWRGFGQPRYGVRKGHFLGIYDETLRVYNTLIDRMEVIPLAAKDHWRQQVLKESMPLFAEIRAQPWKPFPESMIEKLRVAHEMWREKGRSETVLHRMDYLMRSRPTDRQLLGWRVRTSLENKDWAELEKIGEKTKNPLWTFVARRNLEKPTYNLHLPSGCESAFRVRRKARITRQECDNPLFLALDAWSKETEAQARIEKREAFLRDYIISKVDEKVAEGNFVNFLNWDVDTDRPTEPHLVEFYLALPRARKMADVVTRRLSQETIK